MRGPGSTTRREAATPPRDYLSQFHPAYTSEDEANRLAADAGFPGWVELFKEPGEGHEVHDAVTAWLIGLVDALDWGDAGARAVSRVRSTTNLFEAVE